MKTLLILFACTAATIASAEANLVISEIDLVGNKVEIINTGSSSINMTGYQWCNLWKGSPAYVALATSQIVAAQSTSTTLTLPAGGILTFQLTASFITDLQGELGLYSSGSFGSSTAIVDYISWGGDAVRDSVAAGKVPSIWGNTTSVSVTAADISAGRSIQLGAGLAGNVASDYSLAASTIGVNQVTPAPVVTTGSASGITATTATLSGTVNAKGFSTAVTFQYGETLSYGSSIAASPSPVTGSSDTAVSAVPADLIAGKTYNFRVVGMSANGTTLGANQTFTTPGPPSATTGGASGVTNNSATFSGNVTANGANTTVTFEYGETLSYGMTATGTPSLVSGFTSTAVSASVGGLDPGKIYHYRVVAASSIDTTEGADQTFTTADAPVAITGVASGITDVSASVAGIVDANGASTTVTIQYGETTSYGSSVTATPSPVTGFSPVAISGLLTGLDPSKTYHFRVVASNAYGSAAGLDGIFTTTATPPAVIVLTNTGISRSGNILTVNFSGPPNVLPSAWRVVGSATLASFPDNKTANTTFSENPVGSGKYLAVIDITGEPPTYFVRIALPPI